MTLFYRRREPMVRLSVSVSRDLVTYVQATAKAAHAPMSAVVVDALRLHQAKTTSDAMVAGLREDALRASAEASTARPSAPNRAGVRLDASADSLRSESGASASRQ